MRILQNKNLLAFVGLVIVILAMAIPRLPSLDHFVTADEAKWLTRSANYFTALAQRDIIHTYQKEHPGVTVMWVGTAGFLWRFPGYVTEGPGQHDRQGKSATRSTPNRVGYQWLGRSLHSGLRHRYQHQPRRDGRFQDQDRFR